jgi:hypothetical protein
VVVPALPGRRTAARTSPVGVGAAQHGVESEAALVGGPGAGLVLGVDLDQRRVGVEHDRGRPRRRRRASPHLGPHLGHRLPQPRQGLGVDGPQPGVQRRVRRHRAEQLLLGSELFDVGARLPAAGEHEHGLHQHLASVVQRQPLAGDRDARRQGMPEPQTVGKSSKGVEAGMGDDLVPARFHLHADGAVSVHLASALLTRDFLPWTSTESLVRRALPRMGRLSSRGPAKNRG